MRSTSRIYLALLCLVAAEVFIYGSHLHNEFHFDDYHTILQNPYVHDIHNAPRFFVDGEISSVLPVNRVYRPVVFASLTLDNWLGHGTTNPVWFHVSTLIWFVVQLLLIFVFSRNVFARYSSSGNDDWAAFFATAVYGLHPVMAETVNYINQRAEVLSTLGVIAGLMAYIRFPAFRRYGLYLAPVVIGVLSKAPALVFPALLFLYLWMIEEERPQIAFMRSLPALAAIAALSILTVKMTPGTFSPGGSSTFGYLITQPLVILRYFMKFFVPTGLSADTDHAALNSLLDDGAIQGLLFLAVLIAAIVWSVKRRETRPVAFGLAWFLVALLPTSVLPLAEVENDHRMFFPFVGLAIAVTWGAVLLLRRRPVPRAILAPVSLLLLAGCAYGSWVRCEVWKTEESLWYDVTIKSPHNGRGLMNYGLVLMSKGQFPAASQYFERAAIYLPSYYVLEVNRGILSASMNDPAGAEPHFRRAISLAPTEAVPKFYYAKWLHQMGRNQEAADLLQTAIAANPSYVDAYYLLMQDYSDVGNTAGLRTVAQLLQARFPDDPQAQIWLTRAANPQETPEVWLNRSLAFYQAGKYADCIDAAMKALKLRPGYAEAWNNIAAAYNAQGNWDEGIEAGETAVKLNPSSQLAKNNLAWALQNKAKAVKKK